MEKENIMTVDIEDFKKSQHILDYIDDDFAIVNSLDGIPYSNDTVRLNCFLIAVCVEGCIQLDINYRTYQLQAGDLLLGLPNTLISRTMLSPKYKIRLAGFSTRFLQRIIKMEKKTWNTAAHIHNNPVKSISEGGDEPVFRFYRDLIVAPSFVRCWDSFTRKLMLPIRGTARKKVSNRRIIPCGNSWSYYRRTKVCTVL